MANQYRNPCHIARMNPNHPFLQQGQTTHYSADDSASNSESIANDSEPLISESYRKFDNTIKLLLEQDDFSELDTSYHTRGNFHKSGAMDEEAVPCLPILTTPANLSKMMEILEDDACNTVILETRSSPMSFHCNDHETEATQRIKTPTNITPIKATIVEDDVKKKPRPKMDWNNYHPLGIIHEFLDDLEYDYPSLCTAGAIGQSLEGRDIKIIKISNSDTTNACVWIDAGIHAREWIAPAVATYIANHIATNFNSLPNSVTNKDWYILPVANPDGYEYTHKVDRMWRKNRAWYSGQCVGVDLNRNFSFGWGGKGSSSVPSNAFYRGPKPFSEPESRVMRDMLVNSGISFKVYITLHSYGQVIIFPFAFKDELCPDYVRLLEGATVMSKAIHEASGNTYKVGISRDVMYDAAGTSNDWSYGQAGIPFCYLIELRSRKHKFKLPQEEIEETGNEILNCVKALMEFVDKYPLEHGK